MKELKDVSVFIEDKRFNFRVGAIMEYKGSIMIEKSTKVDHAVLPGGRVQILEDTKNALIREINEEMKFDISKKNIILNHIIENFFESNGTQCHELYFVYRIKLDDNDELVKRKKEKLINYDSDRGNWYEFIKMEDIDSENIKPSILKSIVKNEDFGIKVIRN